MKYVTLHFKLFMNQYIIHKICDSTSLVDCT